MNAPAPLTWGHGPAAFEAFLEPTCPYSGKAFPKLFDFLKLAGEDKVTLKIRLHSQPWHMFSGITCRAIIAASTLPGGREKAKAVMAAIYANCEAFEFDSHAKGPNMNETPKGVLARIAKLSGIEVAEAFAREDLDKEVKWHTRYARQNGIHLSPTFMVNGLVRAELGSGDSSEKWRDALA